MGPAIMGRMTFGRCDKFESAARGRCDDEGRRTVLTATRDKIDEVLPGFLDKPEDMMCTSIIPLAEQGTRSSFLAQLSCPTPYNDCSQSGRA